MVLAASLVARNELSRYLPIVIEHLRGFCDQITVLDDGSTDGTLDWLRGQVDGQLAVGGHPAESFDQHEGHVRQALLTLTLARKPTHVLAIDCDELISAGAALRATLEASPETPAWTLEMNEVWSATPEAMRIRMDGAWRPYSRVHLWRVPETLDANWQIPQKKLACSPVPLAAHANHVASGAQIFHFGWVDPSTRQARYDRYMRLDNGRFHARTHLQSIMWPEARIITAPLPWPQAAWAEQVKGKLL